MKFETVAIFITGEHFNQEKSMIFRQLASVAGCVQSFMSAQKFRNRISGFGQNSLFCWNNKFVLNTKIGEPVFKMQVSLNLFSMGECHSIRFLTLRPNCLQ